MGEHKDGPYVKRYPVREAQAKPKRALPEPQETMKRLSFLRKIAWPPWLVK